MDFLMGLPFLLLLISIAAIPFISRRWWDKWYPAVSLGLGGVTVVSYYLTRPSFERMIHTTGEYGSFIVLLGSLFVVAGGILIRIRGKSTPLTNVALLAVGAIVSNVLGTTGASMILIRPFLRSNRYRLRGYHTVFFIFVVSNIGGALTPIGDPPLFLGYLRGVPFLWVFSGLWHMWLLTLIPVLLTFFVIDTLDFRKFERSPARIPAEELHEEAEVSGLQNIIFLAAIIGAVFIQHPPFAREAVMILAAVSSYFMTPRGIHRKNDFNFGPIKEVAILFAGIFATMVPALEWLEANATTLGLRTSGQFFWGTGLLSSVLDNAPTYLNFLTAAIGLLVRPETVQHVASHLPHSAADLANLGVLSDDVRNTILVLWNYHQDLVISGRIGVSEIQIAYLLANHSLYVQAVSFGAVVFGAMTYIGNGPNFMVKSIAERSGVEVPGFVEYIIRYAVPLLLPVFFIVWLTIFSG